MENNNLPVVPEKSLKEQIKKLLNKLMDILFTNHSEAVVIAEFDENGRRIDNNEEIEVNEVESDFDEAVIKIEDEEIDREHIEVESTNEFEESLKVDLKTFEEEKKLDDRRIEFIDELEENPELMVNLSMEKLKRIEEYYDELIEDLDRKIAKASKKVS